MNNAKSVRTTLGRIKIPALKLRRLLEMENIEDIKISLQIPYIVIKNSKPKQNGICSFCGSMEGTFPFKRKSICETCNRELLQNSSRETDDFTQIDQTPEKKKLYIKGNNIFEVPIGDENMEDPEPYHSFDVNGNHDQLRKSLREILKKINDEGDYRLKIQVYKN